MRLRLGGARADGAPGDEVGEVLRGDRIERFGAAGQAELVEIDEELARDAQALLYVKGVVEVRVVDEPFQPTVVRGFSKYTRMTRKNVSWTSRARAARRRP